MANTLELGNGKWATGKDTVLAFNDENNNFKPLPFSFSRASSGTVVNKDGLIETVGSGEPRIDFSNDAKGALLLEPSRTNSLLQSNQFDTTWSTSNATTTSGQIGVGGSLDAWKLESSGSSASFIFQGISTSVVTTRSIYAKAGSVNWFSINSGGSQAAYFDLSNGVVGTKSSNIIDATMESVGDGWYRCSVEIDSQSNFYVFVANTDNSQASNSGDSIYIQYAQLEQGSYPTSYIPTSGSAVTRVEEEGIDGGAGAPIFSNTSAVWFIDLERIGIDTDSDGSAIALRNSSFSQQIRLHFDQPAANIRFRDGVNGYATISTITGANTNVRKKLALRIDGNTLSTFSNGSKIGSDYTAPNSFNIDEVDFSSIGFKLYDMRFYNTALTDQELIALTTI